MLHYSVISNVHNSLVGEPGKKDTPYPLPNRIDGNWDNFWLKGKLGQRTHPDAAQRQFKSNFVPPSPNSGYNSVAHSPTRRDRNSSQRLSPLPTENATALWSSFLITPNSELSSAFESSPASPGDVTADVLETERCETSEVSLNEIAGNQWDMRHEPPKAGKGKRSRAHFSEIVQDSNTLRGATDGEESTSSQRIYERKETRSFSKRPRTHATQAASRTIRATSTSSPSSPTAERDTAAALENGADFEQKGMRGLRHFSKRVCDKVQTKGVTTYNEVADELAVELSRHMVENGVPFSQKNIRRRVYDALNVLMAIGVIKKEKKEIEWLGLPSEKANHPVKAAADKSLESLMEENRALQEKIAESKIQLEQKLAKQVHLKNLIHRNAQRELAMKSGEERTPDWKKLPLPFVLINCDAGTSMKIEGMDDSQHYRREYLINMTNNFAMNEDLEILRQVGMNCASAEQIAEWVAPEHLPYLRLEKNDTFTRGGDATQRLGRRCFSAVPRDSINPADAAAWIEMNGSSDSPAQFLEPPLFLREGFAESYNYVNSERAMHKRTATMERSISPTLLYLPGSSNSRSDVLVSEIRNVAKVDPGHSGVNQEHTPPNTPPGHANTFSERIILPMKKRRPTRQSRARA